MAGLSSELQGNVWEVTCFRLVGSQSTQPARPGPTNLGSRLSTALRTRTSSYHSSASHRSPRGSIDTSLDGLSMGDVEFDKGQEKRKESNSGSIFRKFTNKQKPASTGANDNHGRNMSGGSSSNYSSADVAVKSNAISLGSKEHKREMSQAERAASKDRAVWQPVNLIVNENEGKVSVSVREAQSGRLVAEFNPSKLYSTDISLPHHSLFPTKGNTVIRFSNLSSASRSPGELGENATADRSESTGLGQGEWRTPGSRQGSFNGVPKQNDRRSKGTSELSTQSDRGVNDSTQHIRKQSGSSGIDLPHSETIRDLAQSRRLEQQGSLGRRASHDPISSDFPSLHGYPSDSVRTTRSQASSSSLRTAATEESDETWLSATDGLSPPLISPTAPEFQWTKIDMEDANGNGIDQKDDQYDRDSMTPKAHKVLSFPNPMDVSNGAVAQNKPSPIDGLILSFVDVAETSQWFALLRSFTRHDLITIISGPLTDDSRSTPSPSLYSAFSINGTGNKAEWARVWRSLEIDIQDVKDLKIPGSLSSLNNGGPQKAAARRGMLRSISTGFGQTLKGLMDEEDIRQKREDSLFWQISIDSHTVARTQRRHFDTDVWTESIKLEDISEWTKCTLHLFRRLRHSGQPPIQTSVGYLQLDARDLENVAVLEKKAPLLSLVDSEIIGQVRFRCKPDQLNIKTIPSYHAIIETIQSGNPDRISKLASLTSADGGPGALCRLALHLNLLEPLVCSLIDAEVQAPSATLFRSNTPLTRCLEYVMRVQAMDYVRQAIGDDIRKVCDDKADCKTENEHLQRLWDHIYMSRHKFPSQLRWMFSYLLKAVARYHPLSKHLQLQAVAAFIFLRLIGPCIMWPDKFGLIDYHPTEEKQRTLKAFAKNIINLGFLVEPKDTDRSPTETSFSAGFQKDNTAAMLDYLAACSTSELNSTSSQRDQDESLASILQDRQYALSGLSRDALLGVNPYMNVDVAKDLALLDRVQKRKIKASPSSTAPLSPPSSDTALSTSSRSSPEGTMSSSPDDTFGAMSLNGQNRNKIGRRSNRSQKFTIAPGPPPMIGQRSSSISGGAPLSSILIPRA